MSFWAVALSVAAAANSPTCPDLLSAGHFLHHQRPRLHVDRSLGTPSALPPHERIAHWLGRLEFDGALRAEIFTHVLRVEDVPDRYFSALKRREVERGAGELILGPALRRELATQLVRDQRDTLEAWWTYLSRDTRDLFRPWLRYWALTSVVQLMPYDPERKDFPQRRGRQTALFPELDREALHQVFSRIHRRLEEMAAEERTPEERRALLNGLSFRRLYADELKTRMPALLDTTEGEWRRFVRGSAPKFLIQALAGRSTGWCTAAPETAAQQLSMGDFHVYFSRGADGAAAQPRLAIRMEGARIAEVRGIGPRQNVDPEIAAAGVLEAKLDAMGVVGAQYLRRAVAMRRLTEIGRKAELDAADLRFLYEIDEPIQGFGYGRDPRIQTLLRGRNVRQDLAKAFAVTPDRISMRESEAAGENIVCHYGSLHENGLTGPSIRLPPYILGSLELLRLTNAAGLVFPRVITGQLVGDRLHVLRAVKLPDRADDGFHFSKLTEMADVRLPEVAFGNGVFNRLTTVSNVAYPRAMEGTLMLPLLKVAKGLTLPESVGGLLMPSLTDPRGVTLPRRVESDLYLDGLTSLEHVTPPVWTGGNVGLNGISFIDEPAWTGWATTIRYRDRVIHATDSAPEF